MKYEYLCGYESDFFTMPANVVAVVRLDHCVQGLTEFNQIIECGKPVLAMRRIIAKPNRWTAEDQKAGRMPEVGAKVDGGKVVFVNGFNVVTELKSGAVIVSSPKTFLNTFNPIETPEEKAQREEDEFVDSESFFIDVCTMSGPMKAVYKQGARAAYRKLKGGE